MEIPVKSKLNKLSNQENLNFTYNLINFKNNNANNESNISDLKLNKSFTYNRNNIDLKNNINKNSKDTLDKNNSELNIKNTESNFNLINTKNNYCDISTKNINSNNNLIPNINLSNPSKLNNNKHSLELKWTDINIKTKPSKIFNKEQNKPKNILNNISGSIRSGQTLAILGSSGAGKTTFLNYLSRRTETSKLDCKGNITLNSLSMSKSDFCSISSYVMQDDILESNLTPKETLMYTAHLKYNISNPNHHKCINTHIENKVNNVIKILNIDKCKDTLIGNTIKKGISGGERKRLSIAIELLSDAKIIFLDEPTTSLDSYNSYVLIERLSYLAKIRNKIIIYTIHQPASEIFNLLDKIFIIALGQTIYYGDSKEIAKYLNDIKLPIPLFYNPFEHFIEITSRSSIFMKDVLTNYSEIELIENNQEKYKKFIEILSSLFNNKYNVELNESYRQEYNDLLITEIKESKKMHNFFVQFKFLLIKQFIIIRRNIGLLKIRFVNTLITSVLISLIFNNLGNNSISVQNKLGLLLFLSIHVVFNSITSNFLLITEDRGVFVKERANNLYSTLAFFLSKVIAYIPINFISINMLVLITYFSTGLNDLYIYKFWELLFIVQLSYFLCNFYALFLASLAKNPSNIAILNVIVTVPFLLVSGYYSSSSNLVFYLKILQYLSPFKWVYQLLVINEFSNNKLYCKNNLNNCDPLSYNKFESSFVSYICNVGLGMFYCIMTFLVLFFFVKLKI